MRLYVPAKTGHTSWNITKTLVQTTCFWLCFLVLLPWAIVALEDSLELTRFDFAYQAVFAITLFAVFGGLGLSSGVCMAMHGKGTPIPFDCARELVARGPYAYVRNPMAVAGITQGIAVGVFLGSWITIGYAISGAFVWHLIIRPSEERDLAARFGESYERYRTAVICWWPRRTAYQAQL